MDVLFRRPWYCVAHYTACVVCKPDLVRPALVRPDLVRPDLVRPDLVRPALMGTNLLCTEIQNLRSKVMHDRFGYSCIASR